MTGRGRAAALVGGGLLVAGAGLWVWQHFFSRAAEIDALHRACITDFADIAARMKAGVDPGEGASAFVRSLTGGVSRMLEGASDGVGDAVCSTVRDACRADFDGRICTAARERYG